MNGTLRSNSVQNTKVISYIKLSSDICFSECKIYLFSPDFLFSLCNFAKPPGLLQKRQKQEICTLGQLKYRVHILWAIKNPNEKICQESPQNTQKSIMYVRQNFQFILSIFNVQLQRINCNMFS